MANEVCPCGGSLEVQTGPGRQSWGFGPDLSWYRLSIHPEIESFVCSSCGELFNGIDDSDVPVWTRTHSALEIRYLRTVILNRLDRLAQTIGGTHQDVFQILGIKESELMEPFTTVSFKLGAVPSGTLRWLRLIEYISENSGWAEAFRGDPRVGWYHQVEAPATDTSIELEF